MKAQTLLLERVRDETRLAVIEDGRLMELYVQRPGMENLTGNIYLGRVERVLPGMSAAFVELGMEKNGYLAAGDIAAPAGDAALASALRDADPLKRARPGQAMLTQVVKSQPGGKGPRLSGHITLPGRLMALLTDVQYVGVSRKIADKEERERLHGLGKRLMGEGGPGMILRTAAEGASEEALRAEYERLCRWWEGLRTRAEHVIPPKLLHDDNALPMRAVRDRLGERTEALWVDGESLYGEVLELAKTLAPAWMERIKLHDSPTPLFDLYKVDAQADKALQKYVWLKSGGSLVIEETEALTVVDVNTGKNVGKRDAEDTIFKANCEAAKEMMRQLRLRDIGGIVVADFIDMKREEHNQALLELLRELAKEDATRVNIVGMTGLGLVELTRKKERQSLSRQLLHTCSDCDGNGAVPSHETTARRIVREIARSRRMGDAGTKLIEANGKVVGWIKTVGLEEGGAVYLRADETFKAGAYRVSPVDEGHLPVSAKRVK